MIRNLIIIIFLSLQVMGCAPFDSNHIIGKWKAIEVLEKGKALAIDPSEIRFDFDDRGNYAFQSTIGYKENGSYNINGEMLMTKDKLNKDALEKNVQIIKLSADTLNLKMVAEGKERVLKMVRMR